MIAGSPAVCRWLQRQWRCDPAIGYRATGSSAHSGQNANKPLSDNGRCLQSQHPAHPQRPSAVLVRLSRGKNGTGKCDRSFFTFRGLNRSDQSTVSPNIQPKRGAGRVFAHLLMADKLQPHTVEVGNKQWINGHLRQRFLPNCSLVTGARPSVHH